ncbi:MAG TPA: autotransporter-associated beta strand repeat-containing protein, partial [Verrucomicrobiae bacterium]
TRALRLGVAAANTGYYTLGGGLLNFGAGNLCVGEIGAGAMTINGGTIMGSGNFAVNLGVSTAAVNASMDGGLSLSGTTWYDQGFNTGSPGVGLPTPGSTITTNLSGTNYSYVFANSYTTNDVALVDPTVAGNLTLSTPTACSALSFLASAGNGPMTVNVTVTHGDASTETSTIVVPDWFDSTGPIAFAAGGRANADGTGVSTFASPFFPFLFAIDTSLTNTTSAVVSVALTYNSSTSASAHAAFMAVAGSTGGDYTALPLTQSSYNVNMILAPNAVTYVDPAVVDFVNQSAGAIVITNGGQLFVGNFGTGVYNQSGGTVDVYNYIAFGRSGGNGTYNLTGGALNQDGNGNILVGTGFNAPAGGSAVGVLNQSGGAITSQGQFLCPENSPSTGTYNLSGTGVLVVNNWIAIGRGNGAGTLNMNGGSITKGGGNGTHLDIGASGTGTINQSNGVITSLVSDTWLGETGNGTWNQFGGTNYLGLVSLCRSGSANGNLNLNGGVFQTTGISSGSSLAVSVINFNGGTVQAGAANAAFLTGITFAQVGPGGAIFDSQSYNLTIPQALADNGGGSLTKLGSGTLTLTGANSYGGDTVINGGSVITGTGSTASQTANVTAVDNAGFGVIVQSAGAQYTAANLNLGTAAGASLSFDLANYGNPAQAPLNVSSTLTRNGVIAVSIADTLPQLGQFPLIKYTTLAGSGSFVVASLPVGVTAVIVTNGANNSIDLNIIGVNQPRWDGQAGGTWDTGADTNWINIGTGLATSYTDPSTVLFDDSALGNTTVNL